MSHLWRNEISDDLTELRWAAHVDASVQWSPARAFPYHPCSCLGQELSASCIILSCLTSLWPSFFYRWPNASQNMSKQMPCCHVQEFLQSVQGVSNSVGRPLLAVSTVTYQATTSTSADYWRQHLEPDLWILVDTCGLFMWSHENCLCTLRRTFSMKQQHAVPAGSWRVWRSSQISSKDSAAITCDLRSPGTSSSFVDIRNVANECKWQSLGISGLGIATVLKKLKDTVCLLHVTVSDFIVRDLSEPE